MLKGNPKKITPIELSEEQHQSILRERVSAPWHARVVARARTRPVLSVLGPAVLVLLFLGLLSVFQNNLGATDTASEEAALSPALQETMNQPGPDEQTIHVSVVSTPREATVYLNGDSVGVTPLLAHALKPGEWILSIRKPHFAPFDTVLALEDDVGLYFPLYAKASTAEASALDDAVLPEPALPSETILRPPSPASDEELARVAVDPEEDAEEAGRAAPGDAEEAALLLTTNPPGAEVWLDDQLMGATPLVLRAVQPGMRNLRFQMEGYAPYAAEFELHPLTELHRNLTAVERPETAVASANTAVPQPTDPPPTEAPQPETARRDSLAAQAQRQEQRYQYLAGQGDALFKEGNYTVARSRYEEMLAYKPDDGYALAMIAESKRLHEEALDRQHTPEAPTSRDVPATPPSQEPPNATVEKEEERASEEPRRDTPEAAVAETEEPAASDEPTTPPTERVDTEDEPTPAPTERVDTFRPRNAGASDDGKAIRIVEVHGKRTLEVGEIENFRVLMGPNATTPPVFYWESEAGVFARGRSIDIQFVEAGVYTVTVTALNDQDVDRATFDITVTAPVPIAPNQEVVQTRMQRAPRRSAKTTRQDTEPPTQDTAFEHSALYSSKGVIWNQGGYTWVIATHLHPDAANSEMVRYRVAGYRSEVFEDKEGQGSTAYRLVIGQFSTREAALQARNELPPDIPGGIWLLRLYTPPN